MVTFWVCLLEYWQIRFGRSRLGLWQKKVLSTARRNEGMFVELFRGEEAHVVSLDALYAITFGKKR